MLYADRALIDAQAAASPKGITEASANVQATGMALDRAMQGDFRASWAFVVEPNDKGGTRLVERFRGHMELPDDMSAAARMGPIFAGNMLVFGLFVMVPRQLLGIRDRAEGRPIRPTPHVEIPERSPVVPVASPSPA